MGAAFILIYTSAHAQVFVDASEAYRYVAPQEEHELKVEIAPPQGMPALMNPTLHESVGFVSSKTKVVVPPSSPELAKVLAPQPRPAVLPQPQAVISPKAVERPAPVARPALIEPDYSSAAVWAGETSQSLKWTKTVLEVVRANKRTLDRANDVENFCPGYRKSTSKAQEMCWVVVMSAITKLESSFNPETQAREGNGDLSVGLLAMSGHQCKNARTLKGLKNPIENLKCGTRKMIELVGRDGYISRGFRGGAANWSVLRTPYWATLNGRRVRVGKISQILSMTQAGYREVVRDMNRFQQKARLATAATPEETEQESLSNSDSRQSTARPGRS